MKIKKEQKMNYNILAVCIIIITVIAGVIE